MKDFEHLNMELPHPIHYLLDHPEETRELDIISRRKHQVRLLGGYRDQIHRILYDTLKWMHKKHLHPKLEGRYVGFSSASLWHCKNLLLCTLDIMYV